METFFAVEPLEGNAKGRVPLFTRSSVNSVAFSPDKQTTTGLVVVVTGYYQVNGKSMGRGKSNENLREVASAILLRPTHTVRIASDIVDMFD